MDHSSEQYPEGREFSDLALRKYLSSHDLLQDFVDMVVGNTNSKVGFLHFYDEARDELNLKIWSGAALAQGPITHNTSYHASPSEIWIRSISNRAPDLDNESNKTCLVSKTKILDLEVKTISVFLFFQIIKLLPSLVSGIGRSLMFQRI